MKKIKIRDYILVLSVSMCLFTCQQKADTSLLIATAANMQFAMKEIIRAFTEKTGVACEMVVSSSGTLTAQIKQGAPFDIFVSANMMYPNDLFNSGYTTAAPRIYAYGSLVLWSMGQDTRPGIDLLTTGEVSHIAIANPKTAPYGVAAQEVLKHYGIYERVKSKLVFGESIAQTNHFIVSKTAELGFTAKSVVLSPAMKGMGLWKDFNPKAYTPIAQGAVILKNRDDNAALAQQFYAFLFSEEGKKILTKFGYVASN